MKDIRIDTKLIAANPWANTSANFVETTMKKIQSTRRGKKQQGHVLLLNRLRTLHGPALALFVVLVFALLTGVAYAAVKFAPSLIHVLDTSTSQRGTTEYTVANFADCSTDAGITTQKFELKRDAPQVGDDEVRKILQATCELHWINKFVDTTWPTYGTHKTWQDGDDIFYTRPDFLGTLQSASKDSVTLSYWTGTETSKTFAAFTGQEITAYANGKKVPLNQIKPGDAVFTVARVAETYFTNRSSTDNSNPRPLGIVGVIKLSLPRDYYGWKQNYLTPITPCLGNADESCPQTQMIDIFPREGGEGARNEAFTQKTGTYRTISGIVTELDANSITLKGRSGKLYTVTAPANAFSVYNSKYAPSYTYPDTTFDATLRLGSTVQVVYAQPSGANPQVITPDQIQVVALLLDGLSFKSGNIKQY